MTDEDLLAKAKGDYPVGTKFDSTGGFENCTIRDISVFIIESGSGNLVIQDQRSHMGTLYNKKEARWAKILSKPAALIANQYRIY